MFTVRRKELDYQLRENLPDDRSISPATVSRSQTYREGRTVANKRCNEARNNLLDQSRLSLCSVLFVQTIVTSRSCRKSRDHRMAIFRNCAPRNRTISVKSKSLYNRRARINPRTKASQVGTTYDADNQVRRGVAKRV